MSRLFHVNAFSQHPFGGNPAIVVLGPERSDAELQAMAVEFNLSETAFLTPAGAACCHPAPRASGWVWPVRGSRALAAAWAQGPATV